VAAALRSELGGTAVIRTATLADPEHGLTSEILEDTDVLAWWGHRAHEAVDDGVVDRVVQRVLDGMGLLALHSSHYSKPFLRLMGTRCSLRWRNDGEREIVWTVAPAHAITEGVPPVFVIPEHEMYGEYFDIPPPDELVFISSFEGGEVFRSGCCWTRGKGRVFYFSPGHETFPVYHQPEIRRVLANGVRWARRRSSPLETATSPSSPLGWFTRVETQ
jgi:trehalose utilization protein